jgi:hypothetical protein
MMKAGNPIVRQDLIHLLNIVGGDACHVENEAFFSLFSSSRHQKVLYLLVLLFRS